MKSEPSASKKWIAGIVAASLLSAVSAVLGLLNWIILREAEQTIVVRSSISRWSWQAIDSFSFLLLGMAWLSFVLFVQHYLMKAPDVRSLWGRALCVIGAQTLLLFACRLAATALGPAGTGLSQTVILIAEGALGTGLSYAGIRLLKKAGHPNNGRELV
ncbi:hypothetical protein [Paenibacillus hamazuiensis]|uniref:hypothetical protein n=1 Tax=Paenibacillus hamazuiensis TaxID=2936508 RepID=UPI00200BB2B9|nr:hypothetical protein [Paenibacillus hamazuiensis]